MWPFKSNADKIFEAKVGDFTKKYLEEYIAQLEQINRADLVAIPQILAGGKQEFGLKELPLSCAVKEAYLKNPTVYACVNDISKAVASAPFALEFKSGKDGQFKTIFSTDIIYLLDCPNNTQTRNEFVKTLVIHLLLCGNAIVWKNFNTPENRAKSTTNKKGVSELIILDPDQVEYKADGFEIIAYSGRAKTPLAGNKWKPEEIIHFRLANPLNPFWGISPIQAAYRSVDIDSKILDWWLNSLANGCKKDAILKFKHDLTQTQYQRMRSLIDQQLAGFMNGRGWMILGHEMEIEFLNMSPAELDFTKSRELSSKEIMKIFSVPPPILGDMEASTFNNMGEATKTFWLSTVCGHLNDICSVLTKRLIPDFGLNVKDYYVSYDIQAVEPLRQLYYDSIENAAKMTAIGFPLNEVCKKLNLQMAEVEGGDVGYIPGNVVPIGSYMDTPAEPAAPMDPNAKVPPKDPKAPNANVSPKTPGL